MKLFEKGIMAALVLATGITVFGVGMISSSNIALADHKPNHQQGNPTNPATVTKTYCIEYRHHPFGPGGGHSDSQECFADRDFCFQVVENLETRTNEYTVLNGDCYKKITVVKETRR